MKSAKRGTILKSLTQVRIIKRSRNKTRLTLNGKKYNRAWYKIKQGRLEGYVYGALLKTFKTETKANKYIRANLEFRKKYSRKFTNVGSFRRFPCYKKDNPNGYALCHLTLNPDGTLLFSSDWSSGGDTLKSRIGRGKYSLQPKKQKVNIYFYAHSQTGLDGYSSKEAYKLMYGKTPNRRQLKNFEAGTLKAYEFEIPLKEFKKLIPKK